MKNTNQIAQICRSVVCSIVKGAEPEIIVGGGGDFIDIVVTGQDALFADAIWPRCIIGLNMAGLCVSALNSPLYEGDGWFAMRLADTTVRIGNRGRLVDRPRFPSPSPHMVIAIGGPSAAGKTSVAKALHAVMPGAIHRYVGYTSRPRRPAEVEGIDYYFRTDSERLKMQCDPRYDNFVEARGNWYWTCPGHILREMWLNMFGIHVFFISKIRDFADKQLLFPLMKWVWLEAPEKTIRSRLMERGTGDVESSMAYNCVLEGERGERKPDLAFDTATVGVKTIAEIVLSRYKIELAQAK